MDMLFVSLTCMAGGAVASGAAAQGSKKVAEWIFQMEGKKM